MKLISNISWGKRIFILYTCFAAMIVTLVVMSYGKKVDLVSKDYYAEELNYQARINAINNLNTAGKLTIENNSSNIRIALPEFFNGKNIEGTVHFFRPSDSSLDKLYKLKAAQPFEVRAAELKPGVYLVKVEFSSEGKSYFGEQGITIK